MDDQAAAISAYLDHLRLLGRARTTIYSRARALQRLEQALPVAILEATEDHLYEWRRAMPNVPNTIAAYVSHARSFYDWAFAAGWLPAANPATKLPVPQLGRRIPRPIPEVTLMDVVRHAPPRIRPWLVLAGWAGLRAKEIALLRRERVLDFLAPPSLLIAADATKGITEHIVPMSQFVLDELVMAGLPGHGYVFRRRDGRPGPNTPHRVSQMADDYLHSRGYPETLHMLRHRFGTELYRETRDLRMVQELLGHRSPQSTAGYAMYDVTAAVAAVDRLAIPARAA